MQNIYFFVFCLLVTFIIYWALRNDDRQKFLSDDNADQADSAKGKRAAKKSTGWSPEKNRHTNKSKP